MSRIGKQPIIIPDKVKIKIDDHEVVVEGPKGRLTHQMHPAISVALEDGQLIVTRPSDQRQHRALHGLTRALLANMVTGVSDGFRRSLSIEGIGYNAQVQGKNLVLRLGYSHEIVMNPPDDNTSFEVPSDSRGQLIHIDGIDKQVVGQVAANIRGLRPPEPYKGKGVRYLGEHVRHKAGKAGK